MPSFLLETDGGECQHAKSTKNRPCKGELGSPQKFGLNRVTPKSLTCFLRLPDGSADTKGHGSIHVTCRLTQTLTQEGLPRGGVIIGSWAAG